MSTTTSTADDAQEPWEQLADKRDLFEKIVEEDGPWAPHAQNMLVALDERQEADDGE
ncbi:hypothetical protein [Halorubrum coriense]|uniref:hypothetical protein n=1 Tax=Halorubrum coriense TaxID=64713 RepID=UPI000AF1EA5E|nr:hypothetical protein [Halorubrum coriense]QRG24163.1 hypothetical protein HrrHm1_260 [Halorubrum virus Humcor1]